ncbi:MAG: ABC transporter permease, partial [Holdemania filiformis]
MKTIVSYFRYFKKELVFGPLFKLAEAIFELLVPLVMARIIDVGIAQKDLAYILRQGGVIVGFALVGIVCSLTCQYFAARCSQGMGTELRRAVYHQINLFSAQQVSQFSSSSLITRLTNDVNQVQQAVAMLIRLAIRAPFLVLGSLTMAMVIDRTMALIFLAAIVVIALVLSVLMTCSSHFFKAVQRQLDRISQITQENLEGQRVIRAFSRQRLETQRFDEAAQASYQASMRVGWISGLFNPATQIVINLGIVALLYCGSFQVNGGALSQGNLVALVNYMTQMFLALVVLANLFVIFTKAAASAGRIEAVLKTEPAITGGIMELSKDKDAVLEMDKVSFGYSEGESAIEQISFTIQPHQ